MAAAVARCVHCGFCLPACPTYQVLGEEMDSPRGRIVLMKEVLEDRLPLDHALPHIDRCLGCLGCVTACPSGVAYGDLLTPFREMANAKREPAAAFRRRLALLTLPYPARLRLAAMIAPIARALRRLTPDWMGDLLALLPPTLPASVPVPGFAPAIGARRARVGLLLGCAQRVLAPEINAATIRVLRRNGVDVVVPREQGCCGALSMHAGDPTARRFARRTMAAFPADVDAVVTNAAGCGSGMREYPLLFAGAPESDAASAFAQRVVDVSVFLDRLGVVAPPSLRAPLRVVYHDACHLSHAQGIREEPRRLLAAIPGVSLRSLDDGELCCGSAGLYNVEQPAIAAALGARKAAALLATRADLVATGNIGCLNQLRLHLARAGAGGRPMPVLHTVEILDHAYEGTMAVGTTLAS